MGHMPELGIQRCPMATLEKTVCGGEGGQPEGAIALFQASTDGQTNGLGYGENWLHLKVEPS